MTLFRFCIFTAALLASPLPVCAEDLPPALQSAPATTADGTDSYGFQQMLVYVYQQNPRLQSARQSLKVQDEHVSEAVSGFRPTLNANGDLGRQREYTDGQNWLYGTARDTSLVLTQPLFNGFGTFEQFHAARTRVSAERAHLSTVEEQVLLDSITAYLDVVTKQYIVIFNRDNRDHLRGYVDATEKRIKAGDSTQTDLAQAQSRLAQADANVATAEANWETARATYRRVTGLEITTLAFPPLPEGLPTSAEDTDARARQTPELIEAAEQERAARHDIEVASSGLWPSVSLRASTSDQFSPDLGLQSLHDDSIVVSVSIPLYQGGAEYARVREAKEQREKAHDDMVDTSRFVTQRASQAWYDYHAATLVINASRRTSEAAMHALSGIETEQRQGLRALIDTLDARAEFLNSLITEIQAEESVRLQAYRLLAATGQLTASSLHLDTPLYDPAKHYNKVADAWVGLKQQ